MSKANRKGFTLLEMIIVAGIIIILVALGIPNLLRARIRANETSAIQALIAIHEGLWMYRATYNDYPELTLHILLDSQPPFVNRGKGLEYLTGEASTLNLFGHGYDFPYQRIDSIHYVCTATPQQEGVTGIRHFRINEAGRIEAWEPGGEWGPLQ